MNAHHDTIQDAAKEVTLVLDGKTVTVPKGTTILAAARANGVYIPTLCYLKKLNPIGSCRICSVEVAGLSNPVMSCVTPVFEGMAVTTQSGKLATYRQDMLRFILTNHPLDCPVCERSGECQLQNKTFEMKVLAAFATAERKKVPRADWRLMRYDRNLCIFCERCVKVCWEVQGFGALEIAGNGYSAVIAPTTGERLDCDFCGQCLSVCPVGAISSAVVFSARSWEVEKTQTVCPHCAVGCSFHVNVKNGTLIRVTSDDDIGVNNGNLCARGRFGFGFHQSGERLSTPVLKNGDVYTPVSWDVAMSVMVEKLNSIKAKHGAGSIAVIGGETLSNEDAYLLQKVFRDGLGVSLIDNTANMKNPALHEAVFDTFGASAPLASYEEIGKAGSFVFFGCDAEKENPVIANMVRPVMRDKDTPLYIFNTRNVGFTPKARARVRFNYGAETALIAGIIRALTEGPDGVKTDALFVKSANAVSVESAARASGVSADEIKRIAGELKKAGSPLIFMASEVYGHPKGVEIVKGLSNLAAILGGKTILYREYCNTQGVNDMGLAPGHLPGYAKADGKTAGGGDVFARILDGRVKAVIIAGADPAFLYPDTGRVAKALASAEFVAVTSTFMTQTGRLANLVLPSATSAERDGTYTNNEGRVQLTRKALAPVGESRPDWMIFRDMGKLLGVETHYGSERDVLAEINAKVPGYQGITADALAGGGCLVSYPDRGGKTAGFEFDVKPMDSAGGDYPITAVVGNSLFQLGVFSGRCGPLQDVDHSAWIEIGAEDAGSCGLADGDMAVVQSRTGSVKAKVKVTQRSPKGVVFVMKNSEDAPGMSLAPADGGAVFVRVKRLENRRNG
jgi:formate dehydrogenase alpha subunit